MAQLVIDTSNPKGILALISHERLLAKVDVSMGLQTSMELMPSIEKLFKASPLYLSDLQKIVLGSGPGSYTGLRIGASVAQILAYCHKIPLIGVSSLMAYIPEKKGPFCAVLDAKSGGLYVLFGRKEEKKVIYKGEVQKLSIEAFLKEVTLPMTILSPDTKPLEKKLNSPLLHFEESDPNPLHLVFEASRQPFHPKLELLYLSSSK